MRLLAILLGLLLTAQASALSIWKVSGHDRTFYLFGTIHVLKPNTYPLPELYEKTLKQCDQLWLEIDSNEMNDPEVMGQVQSMMLLPAGQKLRDQLSESAYDELEELSQKAGIPLSMLQGLKPWAVVNQLTLIIFQNHGFTAEGLDIHLQTLAQTQGVDVHAFETLLWQLDMFDTMANGVGDELIEFSTEDMEDVGKMVGALFKQWQTGDYQSTYEQAGFTEYPGVEKTLLIERNQRWMKTLLDIEPSETVCAAVGALHMAGDKGLIQQFKKQGYAVEQVR